MKERTYQIGKSTITLKFGDITTSDAEVLVSSDDYYISMGGGVSGAILRAGGNEIAMDAAKKVPAKLGEVVVTGAGRLKSLFIFHAITLGERGQKRDPEKVVKSLTLKCLELLHTLGLDSIAFPALGAGIARFKYETVALQMAGVITQYLLDRGVQKRVTIYLYDHLRILNPTDYVAFFEAFARQNPLVSNQVIDSPIEHSPAKSASPTFMSARETEAEIKSKRLHHLSRILASLEDQRFRLEEKLLDLLEADPDQAYNRVKEQLKENEELRLHRLKELRDLREAETGLQIAERARTHEVFLSSTFRDLQAHRSIIIEQIIRQKLTFNGMEHFGADPSNYPPASKIVEEVRGCDVYIGVFGVRYGSIDPATGLSMTELEFREAKSRNIPMLLYIMRETANVIVSDFESSPEGQAKLESLKLEILQNHTVFLFETKEELGKQVYEDLGKILSGKQRN